MLQSLLCSGSPALQLRRRVVGTTHITVQLRRCLGPRLASAERWCLSFRTLGKEIPPLAILETSSIMHLSGKLGKGLTGILKQCISKSRMRKTAPQVILTRLTTIAQPACRRRQPATKQAASLCLIPLRTLISAIQRPLLLNPWRKAVQTKKTSCARRSSSPPSRLSPSPLCPRDQRPLPLLTLPLLLRRMPSCRQRWSPTVAQCLHHWMLRRLRTT
mmetsp:Transcript_16776/g.23166  ORF Transcript_16776/g.23166 Transcript_16776/m.23166 type:complete len:217 (+) Transcript_16776:1262-1912(+)